MARDNHKPIKILGSNEGDELGGYHESERLHDTTYADLFGPLQDDSEDDEANEPAEASLSPTNFGNIDNGTSNITTGGLLKIDVDKITPVDALMKINEIKKILRK